MEILRGLLVVIEALLSLMVIGVILLQKSREQGLGLAFGSNIGETIFGSRAGNVLTTATIWLSSLFMINTVALAILFSGRQQSLLERAEGARAAAEQPAAPAPAQPGPGSPAVAPSPVPTPGSAPITVPVEVPAPAPAAPGASEAPAPPPSSETPITVPVTVPISPAGAPPAQAAPPPAAPTP